MMLLKYYPMILGIVDLINDWDEKLKKFADGHMGSVGVGTLLFGGILFVAIMGVNTLNKK